MRAFALPAIFLLTLSSLSAGEPQSDANTEPEQVITGTVFEASETPLESGRRITVPKRSSAGDEGKDDSGDETTARWIRPVEGAIVRWIGRMDETATTDASGKFRLPLGRPVPERGRQWVELWVTKPGETPLAAYVVHRPDTDSPRPAQIHLKPAKKLTVTVVDENGKPVEGADISFMPRDISAVHGKTNAKGIWTGMIPAGDPRGTIIARKSGLGFDYAQADRGKDNESPPSIPDNVRLVLGGARTLRVKVIDMEGNPIPGMPVAPSAIAENSADPGYNTVHFWNDSYFASTTNEDGIAILDWLPIEFKNSITLIDKSDDFYPYRRARIRPGDGVEGVTLQLCPYETISGQVVHADGSPAKGITVIASGRGEADTPGSGGAITDEDGQYEIKLEAEQAYYLKVRDDEWAAPRSWPHVLRIGKPLANVDFALVPPTKLYGQVTAGADHAPVANMRMSVVVYLGEVPQEIQNLSPDESRPSFEVTDTEWTLTDNEGNYEFMLAPSDYDYMIHPPGESADIEPVRVIVLAEITPAEIRKDLHREVRSIGPLTITVVDQAGNPVPHATLLSQYRADIEFHPIRGGFLNWYRPTATNNIEAVTTNGQGQRTTTRVLEKLVIHATSPDKQMQGIRRVDAKAAEAEIVVGSTGSASGILIDPTTGKSAIKKTLGYGIKIYRGPDENSSYMNRFGGETTTDGQGHFTIDGLIPGEDYVLSMRTSPSSSRLITIIHVSSAGHIDLGDVKTNNALFIPPYVPPTPAERTASYFKRSAEDPPRKQLESTVAAAHRMYTRPLILLGRPNDPAAIELFRLFYDDSNEEDRTTPADLRWEFELLALSLENEDVASWANEHGIPVAKKKPPVLLVLDEQGEIVARLPLTLKRNPVTAPKPGMDNQGENKIAQQGEEVLLAFLMKYKLSTRDAETMLDEAFATAAAEDKNVFLICSASWCGPCRMLAKFLDPHHEKLDEYFVFVHLDVSRDTHAQEINKKYKGERSGGVPWYVILDPEGTELISSNMPAEDDQKKSEGESKYKTNGPNMGSPGSPEGIEHFLNMLAATAPEIDPKLLEKMREELEEE